MSEITGQDIQGMITHWLGCPVEGYHGSDYGQDLKALLHNPQASGQADEFIAKLKADIPILQAFPVGSINLYGVQTSPDRLDLVLEVAGQTFTIPSAK
ncbi:MAG: hypothetical protein M0Q44_01405 [Methylobacter sp.]|jgi:hypothetical protein|nr:hypothetical protein [Methylobacter sp.]